VLGASFEESILSQANNPIVILVHTCWCILEEAKLSSQLATMHHFLGTRAHGNQLGLGVESARIGTNDDFHEKAALLQQSM
jgi:hypothetical protein